jgi:hypothetical protein
MVISGRNDENLLFKQLLAEGSEKEVLSFLAPIITHPCHSVKAELGSKDKAERLRRDFELVFEYNV